MPQQRPILKSKYLPYALLALGALLILALIPPLDYRYYSVASRAWREGASRLYDPLTADFFYTPWSLIITVPLSFLPDRWGQAVFNLISLVGLVAATLLLNPTQSRRGLWLALVNPYTASVLILGQWDGLIVASVALGWYAAGQRRPWLLGLALTIVATKPTNAVLPALLLLWAIRGWRVRELATMLVIPALALVASFPACGWDWPVRYLALVRDAPPRGFNTSLVQLDFGILWTILVVGVPLVWLLWLIRPGVTARSLSAALLVNMLISPYLVPYHYVGANPALATTTTDNWRVGVLLWGFSIVAFVAFLARWPIQPMVIYPLGLLIVLSVTDAPASK